MSLTSSETRLIFLIGVLILSVSLAQGQSQKPSTFVDADQYTSKPDQTAQLSGHVKVIRDLDEITCDSAFINMASGDIDAKGNVTYISPQEFIRAEHLVFNINTRKGIIYNGYIQTGQETIEGKEVYKVGENEYQAVNGSYTSCTNCPAGWKMTGSKIDATVGSYAYVHNPIVHIYGIPMLWLPYMVIPIKSERQSGFLAPSYGVGERDGFTVSESYFWAIDRSHDATINETRYDTRGYKTGIEYRYVSDVNNWGSLNSFYITDKLFGSDRVFVNPDSRYALSRNNERLVARYAMKYKHYFELPDNFTNNVDLKLVRDTSYLIDFPNDIVAPGDPSLENRISVAKNTENSHISADVSVYQNFIKADPIGDNSDAIHRVPELRYSYLPLNWGPSGLLTHVDVDYVNFERAGKAFDDPDKSPYFRDNISQFRTGQRLRVNPEISYPFRVGQYLDVIPSAQYEETVYQFGYSQRPAASRRYLRTSIQSKSRMSAIFGDLKTPRANRYKHEFEPDITYTFVPYYYQDPHPFFGPIDPKSQTLLRPVFLPHFTSDQPVTEFDILQFDYRDRLVDRNLITLGISNKIIRKKYEEGSKEPAYSQIISHRLTQSYDVWADIEPLKAPAINQPWSEIRSLFEVKLDNFNLVSDVKYYPYQNLASNGESIGIKNKDGNGISATYSQGFAIQTDPTTRLPTSQVNLSSQSETLSFSLYYTSKYLDVAANVNRDLLSGNNGQWTSSTFDGLIKPPGHCWGINFYYAKQLGTGAYTYMFTIPIFFGEGKSLSVSPPMGMN